MHGMFHILCILWSFSVGSGISQPIFPFRDCERTNLEKCKLTYECWNTEKKVFLSWPFNIDLYRRWNDNTSNLLFKPTAHYIRKDEKEQKKRSKPNETKWNWQKHLTLNRCDNKSNQSKVTLNEHSVADVLLFYFIFLYSNIFLILAKHMICTLYINMYTMYACVCFCYTSVDKSE